MYITNKKNEITLYLDAKCELSGENETLNTHDPCPDNVPARFACCLLVKEVKENDDNGKAYFIYVVLLLFRIAEIQCTPNV